MATLAANVAAHAQRIPDAPAYVTADSTVTWRDYHQRSDVIASALVAAGHAPGDPVAVHLPDSAGVHAAFLGIEKAGCVIVGIGGRAGGREVDHLLAKTGAVAVLDDEAALPAVGAAPAPERTGGPNDLWLLNSTSGTTGLPKIVMHDQARWFAFHDLAVAAGALTPDDVFMSVLPAPFGFGIWTAHVTPTLLGAPCVLMARFDPDECLALIERERVTTLAAVSTQLVMLLEAASLGDRDLTSLRVLFTGGEMVPYERAAAFEERTGCSVLQFYGSNETGALSRTTVRDDRGHRLRTAGRVIPEMRVRLFDEGGTDVTATGGPGIAACKGPLSCLGYYDDPEANARLYTDDGWMLTGDYCTIDADGYLTVAGRASDFIVRGGKNISATQVEDEVASHASVALAAAVAMPDPVFGERVCVYVEQRPATARLTLDVVCAHLEARGVGKELWPERLEVVDALPRSSGGKVAKGDLRADVRRRLGVA